MAPKKNNDAPRENKKGDGDKSRAPRGSLASSTILFCIHSSLLTYMQINWNLEKNLLLAILAMGMSRNPGQVHFNAVKKLLPGESPSADAIRNQYDKLRQKRAEILEKHPEVKAAFESSSTTGRRATRDSSPPLTDEERRDGRILADEVDRLMASDDDEVEEEELEVEGRFAGISAELRRLGVPARVLAEAAQQLHNMATEGSSSRQTPAPRGGSGARQEAPVPDEFEVDNEAEDETVVQQPAVQEVEVEDEQETPRLKRKLFGRSLHLDD